MDRSFLLLGRFFSFSLVAASFSSAVSSSCSASLFFLLALPFSFFVFSFLFLLSDSSTFLPDFLSLVVDSSLLADNPLRFLVDFNSSRSPDSNALEAGYRDIEYISGRERKVRRSKNIM